MCFIYPLNLFGDESTMRARELLSRTEWSIPSITRFYARDVLFPGVLQGVCVIRIDNRPAQSAEAVEVRGGYSIEEAAQSATLIARSRVLFNYPAKTTWSKPWLVNTEAATYDLWECVRTETHQSLADLLKEKIEVGKGDVRSTWAKPMLVSGPGVHRVALTKGKNIVDWGDWSAVAYLDPIATIPPSSKDYTGSRWVQKQVQRIANLPQKEAVIFLKEVSGLEMKRPIRGTILQRDQHHAVAADETALIMYTLDAAFEDLAYATFGLLTSSIYNFFFSLFSTNAHANFKEILRLPVPVWSSEREKQLADATKVVLDAYRARYQHEQQYGVHQKQQVSANAVLSSTHLHAIEQERVTLLQTVEAKQRELDHLIIAAYGITKPEWHEVIERGVPWARN